MKNKIFQKNTAVSLLKALLVSVIIITGIFIFLKTGSNAKTEVSEIKSVESLIQADGVVAPQDQAVLHLQTGGKLVYLPFKEGDRVYQGQIIAKLDTAKLEASLRQAEQDFTAAKAVSDKYYDGRDSNAAESYDDKIKRTAIDATQNKAYDNVVKARQDISDSALVSPINGVITQEDVANININVTSVTTFIVSDLSSLVFRAYVSENDIDFVSVGNSATVRIANGKTITGTVDKIYPDKTTLPTGQRGYKVDIQSVGAGQFNLVSQSGAVLIQSNSKNNVKLIPTWTILNHDSVWVLTNGNPVLRNVMVGKTHGDMTEILSGLESEDKVIANPESIAARKYSIL